MNKKLIFLMCLIYNFREKSVLNEGRCKKIIILSLVLEKIKEKNKVKNINDNKMIEEAISKAEEYLIENFKNTIKKDYHNILDLSKEENNYKQSSNLYETVTVKTNKDDYKEASKDKNFEMVISKETEKENSLQDNINSENIEILNKKQDKKIEDKCLSKKESDSIEEIKTNSNTLKLKKATLESIALSYIKERFIRRKKEQKKNIRITIRQLKRVKEITNSAELGSEFKIKDVSILNDIMVKVPVKIATVNINEMFYGDVIFAKPIVSILSVNNEVFITEKNIVPSLDKNLLKGVLFYEGYLKCQLEYLEDTSVCDDHIYGESKYCITFLPFEGSKEIELCSSIMDTSEWMVNDFILEINKYDFNVETTLENGMNINKYLKLYKKCNIILNFNCEAIIAKKKLVNL